MGSTNPGWTDRGLDSSILLRFWDTIAGTLSHSADNSPNQEQSKANVVAIARASLAAQYPDRSFPAADVQWLEWLAVILLRGIRV